MNRYHRLFELARKRLRSDADYVEFQEFQARWITETLESEIRDRQVLDLGCGNGGYSNYFSEMAKEVVALDFAVPEGLKPGIRFVRQTSATLPFEEHSFDF